MNLKVSQATLKEVLAKLRKGEWLVPRFQRAFVWSESQVYELLRSIFLNRPIGMVTLWAQPQEKTLTDWERIRLKKKEFGDFKDPPSGTRLVLDGRQRLTALAVAFGGLADPDDRFTFSGAWFLDITKEIDADDFVEHCKNRDIEARKLNVEANLLGSGLVPLADLERVQRLNQNINNREFYPDGKYPDIEERVRRSRRLGRIVEVLLEYQLPAAEIPDNTTLSEVCEIFDVLNQTGTKVSTFDLVHNALFADSNGSFVLRDRFEAYRQTGSFALLCDESRQDLLCQMVTAAYLTEEKPRAKASSDKSVGSIKGGDLLETPLDFYQSFDAALEKFDTYANNFFEEVVGARFSIGALPYPVSAALYLALRWRIDQGRAPYKVSTLNRVFKAFWWRNVLSGRYDQGFLTLFASDLSGLHGLLAKAEGTAVGSSAWIANVSLGLDAIFNAREKKFPRLSTSELEARLSTELRGASYQAMRCAFFTAVTKDLVSNETLDRFTTDSRMKVELHHLFPQSWCKDNKGQHAALRAPDSDELAPAVSAFVNFIPLTSASNKKWMTQSPATAITNLKLNFELRDDVWRSAGIDEDGFNHFTKLEIDKFWARRAQEWAARINALQNI